MGRSEGVAARRRIPQTAGFAALTVVGVMAIGVGLVIAFANPGASEARGERVAEVFALSPRPQATPTTATIVAEPAGLIEPGARLTLEPTPILDFDSSRAMATIRTLESFGVRTAGSSAETAAAEWLLRQLRSMGYDARLDDVVLPNGTKSHNVTARSVGTSARMIVLGAHMDTKAPSPGANDNASGCAALLEIARILAGQSVPATVEMVFYGAEEVAGGNPDQHHFGSRAAVAAMSTADRANTAGMISIDMIAYGPGFHSRTMLRGPQLMSDAVLAQAKASGVRMTFLKDPGRSGWSDHEPYELAGIPATWIEWRDDPVYHTAGDTSGHCDPKKIRVAGQLVLDLLRGLDPGELEALVAR